MPHMCGVVTASAALVATAASTALPPRPQHGDPCLRRLPVDRAHHPVRPGHGFGRPAVTLRPRSRSASASAPGSPIPGAPQPSPSSLDARRRCSDQSIRAPERPTRASMRSRRSVADRRRRAATPATRALARASVPTWLSKGPAPRALTANVASARSASGESALSVTATRPAPDSAAACGGVEHPALVAAQVDRHARRRRRSSSASERATRTSEPATSSTPSRSSARSAAKAWRDAGVASPDEHARPAAAGSASRSTVVRRRRRRPPPAWRARFELDGSRRAAERVVRRALPDPLGRRTQPLGRARSARRPAARRSRRSRAWRASRTTVGPLRAGPAGDVGDGAEGDRLGVVERRPRPPGARPEAAPRGDVDDPRPRTVMEQMLQLARTTRNGRTERIAARHGPDDVRLDQPGPAGGGDRRPTRRAPRADVDRAVAAAAEAQRAWARVPVPARAEVIAAAGAVLAEPQGRAGRPRRPRGGQGPRRGGRRRAGGHRHGRLRRRPGPRRLGRDRAVRARPQAGAGPPASRSASSG